MRLKPLCGQCFATYLAPLLAAAPAAAQSESDIIHVTPLAHATVDVRKFPHPVQIFSSQDLSRNGTASVTRTLSQQAAGVNLVNSQANPYQPTILYHGFEISPIQGTPAGLSVYVDGARFNTPFGDLAIWSVLPDEAINSLSIEDGNPVFGLNALGGAINVQMKDGFNNQGGEIQLSGGSFGRIEGNLEYGKQAGNTALYVDLGGTHENGWRDEQSSGIQNFYGDLGWRTMQEELHVNLTLAHSDLNGPGTVPVELLDADPSAQFTGPNRITDKYAKLSTNFQDKLTADTSLQAVLYYDYLRENLSNGNGPNDLPCADDPDYLCQAGGTGDPSTTLGGAQIPNFAPMANAYGYYAYSQLNLNTTNTNGYGGSLQLTNATPILGLANHLVGGLSYDGGFTKYDAAGYIGGIDAARNYVTLPGIPDPGYILDEPGTVPVSVVIRNAYYGLYASDTLNLTPKFSITGSFRFNIANIALHDQNPPDPNAPGGGLTGRHYYEHVNPALGAAYDITSTLMVYGGYAVQNAAPTPAELSCASPEDSCSLANFMSGDPDLKQIVSRTWQAGLRGTAAGPWTSIVTYNADAYLTNTNDEIEFLQSPYNPAGEGYFSNIGNVRRAGFDASLHVDAPRSSLYAIYSYIDATYQSSFIAQSNSPAADVDGNITVQPGDRLPGIPHHIVKFGARYNATPCWTLGIAVTVQSSSYLYGDEANLTPPLPGFAVVDLTTSYRATPALQLFLNIDNITNAKYYNYGTFSPVGADGGVYVAQAPNYSNPRSYSIAAPIAVYAGAKYSF
jgi:outer membrane receptor protein involved in Fe transport